MKINNTSNVDISMAVWLVYDDYDYNNDPNYISATTLMKPIRQLILNKRIDSSKEEIDILDYSSRALGNSIHSSIENAWNNGHISSLRRLGYPESMINRILINPSEQEIKEADNPYIIYMEQRSTKEIDGYTIGGKFDFLENGVLKDFKSTSTYTWTKGTRTDEHQLQGSIYRLIDDRITSDYIRINYIFTDWQKALKNSNPDYPNRIEYKDIPLLSKEDTLNWIKNKLALYDRYKDADESAIPECTREELWFSDPVYKYYANPAKTDGRSTKNFSSLAEASSFKASKGGTGVVITVEGEPKRCNYCSAFNICTQKDKYFNV